jgi:50S ribosomal protein L16 3-hydroxylase
MFELNLSDFTIEEFLAEYWQKKPVVIRQGFKNFVDPISANELAGLAMESEVESRLVYKKDDQWQAEFGPFEDYQRLGDKDWSLVVQALDNWSEDSAQMIEPFRFIPHWRLDDLMVSFATPGGSVGPHIDLYDVFICQGSGKRRWQVGDIGDYQEFSAHEVLLHVEPFESIIDVELNTGDILYIPPGFPHEGITLETSMSFSVGFRTTSAVNLFSGLADHLIDNELGEELITDQNRAAISHSGEINQGDYSLIKNQLTQLFDNDEVIKQFIGCFMTKAKHELDLMPSDEPLTNEDICEILTTNNLMRLGGLRAFYFADTVEQGLCYIDGNEYNFAAEIAPAIKLLCDQVAVTPAQLSSWHENNDFVEFVSEQINAGYWYFAE